jgi:hypothetical protein
MSEFDHPYFNYNGKIMQSGVSWLKKTNPIITMSDNAFLSNSFFCGNGESYLNTAKINEMLDSGETDETDETEETEETEDADETDAEETDDEDEKFNDEDRAALVDKTIQELKLEEQFPLSQEGLDGILQTIYHNFDSFTATLDDEEKQIISGILHNHRYKIDIALGEKYENHKIKQTIEMADVILNKLLKETNPSILKRFLKKIRSDDEEKVASKTESKSKAKKSKAKETESKSKAKKSKASDDPTISFGDTPGVSSEKKQPEEKIPTKKKGAPSLDFATEDELDAYMSNPDNESKIPKLSARQQQIREAALKHMEDEKSGKLTDDQVNLATRSDRLKRAEEDHQDKIREEALAHLAKERKKKKIGIPIKRFGDDILTGLSPLLHVETFNKHLLPPIDKSEEENADTKAIYTKFSHQIGDALGLADEDVNNMLITYKTIVNASKTHSEEDEKPSIYELLPDGISASKITLEVLRRKLFLKKAKTLKDLQPVYIDRKNKRMYVVVRVNKNHIISLLKKAQNDKWEEEEEEE